MTAWAAVSRKTGRVLKDMKGHYAVYQYRKDAEADCPSYGEVKRVRIS